MKEKFLPIGTVVLLKGGLKKIMITGLSSVSRDDSEKVYDYNGCIFPEGIMENVFSLFDAEQIEEVLYMGTMLYISSCISQYLCLYWLHTADSQ
mgnify:CR=1 FL=1